MAHVEKYIKADVTGLFIHYDRSPGHSLSNKDIDTSRTYLNYNLADQDQPLPQYPFLSSRLKQLKTNGRKNQNVVCDWIITQPQDVRDEDSHRFFSAAYAYLSDKYGKKNTVSCYVHMDEIGNTPHMHFCFIPVEVLEDGTEKLNAKAIINRKELQTFHKDLQKAMDDAMGYHISITSGITAAQGGNKTISQLKEETALKKDLPQGKQKVLSKDTSYTPEENRKLQDLAADGIAYRIEKETITAEKQRLSGSAKAINDKARQLQQKEADLKADQDITEAAAKALGASSAKEYTELHEENIQLHETVQTLQEDIHTIADHIGSEIMKEIPVQTDIDYSTVPEQPSESVMGIIQNMIRKIVDPIIRQFQEMKEALLHTYSSIHVFSIRSEDPEAQVLKEEATETISGLIPKNEIRDAIDEAEYDDTWTYQ